MSHLCLLYACGLDTIHEAPYVVQEGFVGWAELLTHQHHVYFLQLPWL